MHQELKEKDGNNYHIRHFEDWLEFISCAERVIREREGGNYGGLPCASLDEGKEKESWFGTRSLQEAVKLAYCGWPEGREKILEKQLKATTTSLLPNAQRFVYKVDTSGDEPDIDLYLQGDPEHMVTTEEAITSQNGKVVRFILNRTASASISSESIVRKGTGLLLTFQTLLTLGYSVEVMIMEACKSGQTGHELYIPVLHAGDPINLDTLAFMFLHPSVLRRLMFAAEECEPQEIRRQMGFENGEGYGSPAEPSFPPPHDLLITWNEGLVDSDTAITPFALDVLRRIGITNTETA